MNEFYLSFQAIFPTFAMISLGYFLKKIRLYDNNTINQMNGLVFRVFLPIILFIGIYSTSLKEIVNFKLISFAIASIIIIFLASLLLILIIEKENSKKGVLIQSIFRSNYILFGIPLVASIYGENNIGVVSLMVGIVVPLYNILAVITLEMFRNRKINYKKLFKNLLLNPLIISAFLGLLFLNLKIELPQIFVSTLNSLGKVATPLALVVLGSSFSFRNTKLKQTLIGVLGKIIIVPLIFIPISIYYGFRNIELISLVALFATPTAVSSYTMASEMGGDKNLAANLVVYSTIFSLFTIFVIVFLLKKFCYI